MPTAEKISYRRAIRALISLRNPHSDPRAELYMHVFGQTHDIPSCVVIKSEDGTHYERHGIYLDPSRMSVKEINDLCALISLKSEHTASHICLLLFRGDLLVDENGVTIKFPDTDVVICSVYPSPVKEFKRHWNWMFFDDS